MSDTVTPNAYAVRWPGSNETYVFPLQVNASDRELPQAHKLIMALDKENRRLRTIVDQLPVTADGRVRAMTRETGTCVWKWDEHNDDFWDTACGESFCFIDGGPKENHTKYCPYCGRLIEEADHD